MNKEQILKELKEQQELLMYLMSKTHGERYEAARKALDVTINLKANLIKL